MPYNNILEKLVNRIPQAIGAILIDWEGEAVQEHCHCAPYDMRFMAAHQAIILNQLRKLNRSQGEDNMIQDFAITTNQAHLVIGCIDDDYSLMMSIDRSCPLLLALHRFRDTVAELRREL